MNRVSRRIDRVVAQVSNRWASFWFSPTPATTVVVMRVALGSTSLGWALSIIADLRTFYFEGALLPGPNYASYRLGLFQWFTGDAAVVVVWVAMVLSSLALITGRWVRAAAPVLWLTTLTMQQGIPLALNAGDLLLRIWTFYFALFAVLTPGRLLNVPLFGVRDDNGIRQWPMVSSWMIRLAQIQLTVVYPATVLAKLGGVTWRDGTAALYALQLQDFERFWLPTFMRENVLVGNAMTWSTLLIEFSLPFLLWTRRTRWFGIAAGVAMHGGFDYAMRLGFFFPAILIGYMAFLQPAEAGRALMAIRSVPAWVSSRLTERRQRVTSDVSARS